MDIQISNVLASNPNEQVWDSEELVFSDNTQTVEISTPPSLSLNSFTSSSTNIKEGQAVTFTTSISNTEELQHRIIEPDAVRYNVATINLVLMDLVLTISMEYSVPKNYDGDLI